MSKNVTDYFPDLAQVNQATESEAAREPVDTDVSGDVTNPQGGDVIDVGNTPLDSDLTPDKADYSVVGDNIVLDNQELSENVKVGDTVIIDVDGTPVEFIVQDVNTIDGEVTLAPPGGTTAADELDDINNGTTITVNIKEESAVFTGDVVGSVTGNVVGNVDGNVTGDIYNENGTLIFDNGDSTTKATFTGVASETETILIENLTAMGSTPLASGANIITDVVVMTVDNYENTFPDGLGASPTRLYLLSEEVIPQS